MINNLLYLILFIVPVLGINIIPESSSVKYDLIKNNKYYISVQFPLNYKSNVIINDGYNNIVNGTLYDIKIRLTIDTNTDGYVEVYNNNNNSIKVTINIVNLDSTFNNLSNVTISYIIMGAIIFLYILFVLAVVLYVLYLFIINIMNNRSVRTRDRDDLFVIN